MSSPQQKEEFWLSGPVDGVPALLQPVAHALIQSFTEIQAVLNDFDEDLLWEEPAGVASVGFHLQHIAGVLDRMFTYAESRPLSNQQLKYLSEEGLENERIRLTYLIGQLGDRVKLCVQWLRQCDVSKLTEPRTMGRKQLPTTLTGLLFHSAEHAMRHTGQLIVTVRIMME